MVSRLRMSLRSARAEANKSVTVGVCVASHGLVIVSRLRMKALVLRRTSQSQLVYVCVSLVMAWSWSVA